MPTFVSDPILLMLENVLTHESHSKAILRSIDVIFKIRLTLSRNIYGWLSYSSNLPMFFPPALVVV